MLTASTHIQLYRIFLTLLVLLVTAGQGARAQQTGQPNAAGTAAALPAQGEEEQEEEEQRGMRRTYRRQRANPVPVESLTRRVPVPKRTQGHAKGTSSNSNTAGRPAQTGAGQKTGSPDDSFVGFTVWQMRDSGAAGPERRKLVKRKGDRDVVQRPFRVKTDTRLAPGEAYVFSIESTKTGYLYIVDQEEFADGTLGEPSLIYPDDDPDTRDNRVTAGRVVEIPSQKTGGSVEAQQSGPNHVGEVLTIIVAPEPLVERAKIERGADPQELKGLLKTLQEKWGSSLKVKWTEVSEEIGKLYTEREGNAAAGAGAARLTDQDPLPQRLYQIIADEGSPLMVNVRLRYDVK